jgi:hypothetical protein
MIQSHPGEFAGAALDDDADADVADSFSLLAASSFIWLSLVSISPCVDVITVAVRPSLSSFTRVSLSPLSSCRL